MATSSAQSGSLAMRVRALAPRGRAWLSESAQTTGALHNEVSALAPDVVVAQLGLDTACHLCRILSASRHLVDKRLLEAAATLLRSLLTGVSSGGQALEPDDADASAALALAACEAGHSQLGGELVEGICAAGLVSGSHGSSLSGAGASALLLAAAASGRADVKLLDSLLTLCSAREMDLDMGLLGDVRLAALLAGPEVVAALDVIATGFLRTLCSDVALDDPRGPIPEPGSYTESLTPLESEVSEALAAAEVPHCKGSAVSGAFFPLSSIAKHSLFCVEEVAAGAVYINAPTQRTAWQSWKYKAATQEGWKMFLVPEAEWRGLVGLEERAAYLRQLSRTPVDVTAL